MAQKKEIKGQVKEQKKLAILLRTMVNGYSLEVNGEGYMYFCVADVVEALTDSPNPRNYWKVLKHRLVKEGNETVTNCHQLKLKAEVYR